MKYPFHCLLSFYAAFVVLAASTATAAPEGFIERRLALPEYSPQRGMAVTDIWTAPTRETGDGKETDSPVLFAQYRDARAGRDTFAFWRLGKALRSESGPIKPNTLLKPQPMALGVGYTYYCLARLAPTEGPSLLFATRAGVIAFASNWRDGKSLSGTDDIIEPEGWTRLSAAAAPSSMEQMRARYLFPAVFALDLDGDGKDELILPDAAGDGSWTAHGGGEGQFRPLMDLPVSRPALEYDFSVDRAAPPGGKGLAPRRSISYFQDRAEELNLVDLDGDGKREALRMAPDPESPESNEIFQVLVQKEDGFSTQTPRQVVRLKQSDARREWRDLDGDGWLDLIETSGNYDLVAPLMMIDIYLATGAETDLRETAPTRFYHPRNPYGLVAMGDWDGDGDTDIAHTHIERSFGSPGDMAKMMFGKNLDVDLKFYALADGNYPMRPTCQIRVEVRAECLSYHYPPELLMRVVDDLTGDGLPDALVRRRRDLATAYSLDLKGGTVGRGERLDFEMSEYAFPRVNDLDGDGKADIWWHDPERGEIVCLVQK